MSDDLSKRFEELLKALEKAGGYDAKPSELRQGCYFDIEDISLDGIMTNVIYGPPKKD